MKILIADDEKDQESLYLQRFSRKEYLKKYELVFVHDGKEALHQIHSYPDIVFALLDLNMPGIDGLTIVEKAKAINPKIVFFIISAYDDESNIVASNLQGVAEFISKPIDFKILDEAMRKHLE